MEEKKENKALKAGIWYTVSAIMIRSVSILTTPLYTRLMSTSDYGIVTSFVSWQTLLLTFCTLNLTYSIGKAKQDFPGKLKEYVSSMILLSLLVSVVICVWFIFGLPYISNFMEITQIMVILLCTYLLFMPIIQFVQSECRFLYEYRLNVIISITITLLTVVLSLVGIILSGTQKYVGRAFGIVLPCVLISLFFWIRRLKRKEFSRNLNDNLKYWKYGLTISIPLIAHVLSVNILTQSDRILVARICGDDFGGIYGLAYQYGILISVVTNAVLEAWQPWFFDSFAEGSINKINKAIVPLSYLMSYICIACIAIAPEAIAILGGKAYDVGKWVVPPIALAICCQFVYSHYINIEMYEKKTKYIVIGTVIAAVLNILLNVILIPRFGFVVAGYTTLASYFVLYLAHRFIVNNVLKVDIYNDIFLLGILLMTGVISLCFLLLYNYIVIRYVLLLIGSGTYVITNRKALMKLAKRNFD